MNEPAPPAGAPRKILLATDLSARGDRALERAISIARRCDAALIILHVFEELDSSTLTYGTRTLPSWHRPPDAATLMKHRIRQGLRSDLGDAVEKAVILVEAGNPAEVIERVASSEQADIVVTGIAREGMFASRPVVLGKTVEQLLRRLPVPILIVRNRARDAYQHIVVTTDFSESSAHALQMAVRFFPAQPLYLLPRPMCPIRLLPTIRSCTRSATAKCAPMNSGLFWRQSFCPTTIESGWLLQSNRARPSRSSANTYNSWWRSRWCSARRVAVP